MRCYTVEPEEQRHRLPEEANEKHEGGGQGAARRDTQDQGLEERDGAHEARRGPKSSKNLRFFDDFRASRLQRDEGIVAA